MRKTCQRNDGGGGEGLTNYLTTRPWADFHASCDSQMMPRDQQLLQEGTSEPPLKTAGDRESSLL